MKEIVKVIIRLAVVGVTLSACILSSGGIFALPATLAVFRIIPRDISAKLSSFFAAAIEGTIYKQNAEVAVNFSLQRGIAKRLLKNHGKQNPPIDNLFLKDYMTQSKYLHELEEGLNEFGDKETAEREIQAVEKRLESMEDLFMTQILQPSSQSNDPIIAAVNELALANDAKKEDIEQEINSKDWQLWFSKIASAGAGLCCSLVTYAAFKGSLADFGFSFIPTSLLIGGSVISVLAGAGYLLLMYRTLSYLIQSKAAEKWLQKAKDFYKQKNKSNSDKLKAIVLVLFLIATVVGTIATAGTWLYLGGLGASSLLPSSWAANILLIGTWSCMLIPTFLYNVINTLKSVSKFPFIFKEFWRETCKDFAEAWKNENILQFINPARLAMKFSKIIIFLGHVIATGAGSASDKNPFISPEPAIVANAITEGATDLHQIAETHGHHHTHEEKEKQATKKDCHEHAHNGANGHGHSHGPYDTSNTKKESEEDDDHHHHGAIILDEIIWVCKSAAVVWDYALGKLGNWFGFKPLLEGGYYEFHKHAVSKFFPDESLPVAPSLSKEWKQHELNERIDKEIDYYKGTYKESSFSYIKTQLNSNPDINTAISSLPAEHSSNLSTHRHWFRAFYSTPATRAQEVTESLVKDRCLNSQAPGG